jgi:hypothetical protein
MLGLLDVSKQVLTCRGPLFGPTFTADGLYDINMTRDMTGSGRCTGWAPRHALLFAQQRLCALQHYLCVKSIS